MINLFVNEFKERVSIQAPMEKIQNFSAVHVQVRTQKRVTEMGKAQQGFDVLARADVVAGACEVRMGDFHDQYCVFGPQTEACTAVENTPA
jgi:hypothetical protein